MTSQLDVRLGCQEPTILHRPPGGVSLAAAEEAIELADAYGVCDGFPLSESQRITLRNAGAERADGSWAASRVADFGPRQGTGKNDKIAAWELAHLLLFNTQLIIHTAHEFPTANESFLRLVAVFENWDDLRSRVARIRYANGEQGIELLSGQRLKYRARTGGSGRGFAKAGLLVYDEAQHLGSEHVAASGPSKMANPNSQTWYAGSGGLTSSTVAWAIRRAALAGTGGRLAYTEMTGERVWIDGKTVKSVPPDPADRDVWYATINGLGRWVTEESVEALFDELGPELFAREVLCVWDPLPSTEGAPVKLPADGWADSLTGRPPTLQPGEMTMAYDVSDGWASISVGAGSLGQSYVACIEHKAGAGWLPSRLVELVTKWRPTAVGLDGGCGPAVAALGEIREALQEAGHDPDVVKPLTSAEYKQACGAFYQAVDDRKVKRPRVTPDQLETAGAMASERIIGADGAFVWNRSTATVPVAPLVSATIARSLLSEVVAESEPMFAFSK